MGHRIGGGGALPGGDADAEIIVHHRLYRHRHRHR